MKEPNMPALTSNALAKDTGIAGEVRRILDFAMNDESELEPMLAVVTRLLQQGLTSQVDPAEAMEVALAVVDAVSAWLKHRTDPMWAGGARRIANSLRARLMSMGHGRAPGRAPARARGLVATIAAVNRRGRTAPARVRWLVIARAHADYLANKAVRGLCSEAAFLNGSLREAGLPLLTPEERAKCIEA